MKVLTRNLFGRSRKNHENWQKSLRSTTIHIYTITAIWRREKQKIQTTARKWEQRWWKWIHREHKKNVRWKKERRMLLICTLSSARKRRQSCGKDDHEDGWKTSILFHLFSPTCYNGWSNLYSSVFKTSSHGFHWCFTIWKYTKECGMFKTVYYIIVVVCVRWQAPRQQSIEGLRI